MPQSPGLLTGLIFVGVSVALFVGVAGLRRIPWRHAATMAAGFGTVLAALWFAVEGVDPPVLILVAALGGVVAQRGFDQGERERQRIADEITSGRTAPQPRG